MANEAQHDGELVPRGPELAVCELSGGADALATVLVDVRVVPGADLLLVATGSAGAAELPLLVWGEPAFLGGPAGELSLLELDWQPLDLPGEVSVWRAPGERELLLGGRPCDAALRMRAPAGLRVRVPPGCARFVAECGFDGAVLAGPLVYARCSVHGETPA